MSRRGQQLGLLLEVFLLILIIILFTMFWNTFSKTTFLVGLFKVDDTNMEFSCGSMIQVIVGTDYIKASSTNEESVRIGDELKNYLGFQAIDYRIPDAQYFYDKIVDKFPELSGRVGVEVTPRWSQGSDFQTVYEDYSGFTKSVGIKSDSGSLLTSLISSHARLTSCEFPIYSTSSDLTAIIKLTVIL